MKNKQARFYKIAREISLLSDFKRARVGAVVVEKNRIISTGYNSEKTSPLQKRYNRYRNFDDKVDIIPKVHAEVAALAPLRNRKDIDWAHVSLYIYRELKNGTVSCSKPCESCTRLIRDLGIKTIYYTDWEGNFIKESILDETKDFLL